MTTPRVFLSSTYLDLRDVRDSVDKFLTTRGFSVTLFERGGVFYDPTLPLDESCYKEVRGSHLVILIIGGKYGSRASIGQKLGHKYISITRQELETAISESIPILVFVRREVDVELRTYLANPKKTRETVKYASVDDTQVFQLLEQIYLRKNGNPVFTYGEASDITTILNLQLAGFIAQILQERRDQSKTVRLGINGLKLFYYRNQQGLTQKELAEKADVPKSLISRLEKVKLSSHAPLGEQLFQTTNREAIEKIENALGCQELLISGKSDDFLSLYIQYYCVYKEDRRGKGVTQSSYSELFLTKTLVLDFDGTLTIRSNDDMTTWERLWVSVGYTIDDCSELARKYVKNGKVNPEDHRLWCSDTCKKFKERGFSKNHLLQAAKNIKLVPKVNEVLIRLHSEGVSLFLLSGSIRDVIREVLGSLYELFDEVHANNLIFDSAEQLTDIRGTYYDFEGKGEFIKKIIEKQDISPLEVLFVGNSLNDIWACNSGARTLCVNPHFTNPNDTRYWTYCLRKMEDFSLILPYLGR